MAVLLQLPLANVKNNQLQFKYFSMIERYTEKRKYGNSNHPEIGKPEINHKLRPIPSTTTIITIITITITIIIDDFL